MNVLVRSCGNSIVMLNNACEDQKDGDVSGKMCECNTDLCNGATVVMAKSTAFIMALAGLLVTKFSM